MAFSPYFSMGRYSKIQQKFHFLLIFFKLIESIEKKISKNLIYFNFQIVKKLDFWRIFENYRKCPIFNMGNQRNPYHVVSLSLILLKFKTLVGKKIRKNPMEKNFQKFKNSIFSNFLKMEFCFSHCGFNISPIAPKFSQFVDLRNHI